MFKKILVSLDGSKNAEAILPWIQPYAKTNPRFFLARVIPPGPSATVAGAQEYLTHLERSLKKEGLRTRPIVATGRNPAKEIADVARREGCDLIAMATRGETDVRQKLKGSITDQVLQWAQCPVYVARIVTPRIGIGMVKRILVPLDGSVTSELIIPWIDNLAAFHGAEVEFLHIAGENSKLLKKLHDRIQKVCERMGRRGVSATLRVERGNTVNTILHRSASFDLIAMTTHGESGIRRIVIGSVAEKIIRDSILPVMVFRPRRSLKPRAKAVVQ